MTIIFVFSPYRNELEEFCQGLKYYKLLDLIRMHVLSFRCVFVQEPVSANYIINMFTTLEQIEERKKKIFMNCGCLLSEVFQVVQLITICYLLTLHFFPFFASSNNATLSLNLYIQKMFMCTGRNISVYWTKYFCVQ